MLMYDKFEDGSRTVSSLPYSAKWITKMPSNTLFAAAFGDDYRLETTYSGIQQFWAYFTDNGNPVVLEVGQQLRLSFRLQMLKASDASWDRALMFGLFNSMGTRDTADYAYNSALRKDDVGYFVITNPGRTTDNYAKICKVTENTYSDHFVNYTQLAAFRSYNMTTETVDIEMQIIHIKEGLLISAIVGPDSYIYDTFIQVEGPDYTAFDTFSILLDGMGFPGDVGAMGIDFVGVYLYETDSCSGLCGEDLRLSGDINRDCYVDIADFAVLVNEWLKGAF